MHTCIYIYTYILYTVYTIIHISDRNLKYSTVFNGTVKVMNVWGGGSCSNPLFLNVLLLWRPNCAKNKEIKCFQSLIPGVAVVYTVYIVGYDIQYIIQYTHFLEIPFSEEIETIFFNHLARTGGTISGLQLLTKTNFNLRPPGGGKRYRVQHTSTFF